MGKMAQNWLYSSLDYKTNNLDYPGISYFNETCYFQFSLQSKVINEQMW